MTAEGNQQPDMEKFAQELGKLQGEVGMLTTEVRHHMQSVDSAFSRGSEKMDKMRHEIDTIKERHQSARWKQWIAIVIVAASAGKASPWIWKFLGLPIPPP